MDKYVHYNSWYISLPYSGKQQREILGFWKTKTTSAIFAVREVAGSNLGRRSQVQMTSTNG